MQHSTSNHKVSVHILSNSNIHVCCINFFGALCYTAQHSQDLELKKILIINFVLVLTATSEEMTSLVCPGEEGGAPIILSLYNHIIYIQSDSKTLTESWYKELEHSHKVSVYVTYDQDRKYWSQGSQVSAACRMNSTMIECLSLLK